MKRSFSQKLTQLNAILLFRLLTATLMANLCLCSVAVAAPSGMHSGTSTTTAPAGMWAKIVMAPTNMKPPTGTTPQANQTVWSFPGDTTDIRVDLASSISDDEGGGLKIPVNAYANGNWDTGSTWQLSSTISGISSNGSFSSGGSITTGAVGTYTLSEAGSIDVISLTLNDGSTTDSYTATAHVHVHDYLENGKPSRKFEEHPKPNHIRSLSDVGEWKPCGFQQGPATYSTGWSVSSSVTDTYSITSGAGFGIDPVAKLEGSEGFSNGTTFSYTGTITVSYTVPANYIWYFFYGPGYTTYFESFDAYDETGYRGELQASYNTAETTGSPGSLVINQTFYAEPIP